MPREDFTGEPDWGAFFGRYRPLALRIARGMVRGLAAQDQAEELVQEAARALIERSRREPPLESSEHARNHFLKSLRHLAISAQRSSTRRGPREEVGDPVDLRPGAEDLLADAEERDWHARRLARALDTLSAAERAALDLRYREGLAYKEMAQRTKRPISTLQAQVESALEKIRNRIGRPEDGA